jgi:arylsulfatase A-like enzyme
MGFGVTRREFLGATAGAATLVTTAAGQPIRPNVLFILADDLGYGDLSAYGRPDYRTPVLDGLARQGLRFTSAYSAGPVCTPTRCAFFTGRYPHRVEVGLYEPLTGMHLDKGLPPDHPTLASLLRGAGYDTALVGKWHLGWKPEFGPNRHGFDEFFGILSGAGDYFTHEAGDGAIGADLWQDQAPVARTGYATDLFTDRAAEFLGRRRTRPFYLSLHYTAPHSPWEGPEDAGTDHTAHGRGPMTDGGSLMTYAAMMRRLDDGIGRVLQALRRANAERDTLVIFTSDNGGERYSFNWPFSSAKGDVREGGIRVPAIVRWPAVVPANRATDHPCITMDWMATILGLAGAQPDPAYPLDGDDLMPVLRGAATRVDRSLFWRTSTRAAARIGNWKYVNDAGTEHLFDLAIDPGEKTNLRQKQPAAFERLKRAYDAWNASVLPRLPA